MKIRITIHSESVGTCVQRLTDKRVPFTVTHGLPVRGVYESTITFNSRDLEKRSK